MPALSNPRWERFAQAIVYGENGTKKHAYIEAGYKARGNAAETSATRLFRIVQPVRERVRELLDEQKAKLQLKDRYTRETIASRLAKASAMAERLEKPADITTSEMAIAKQTTNKVDFNAATSLHDIGRKLLQSVGVASPDDVSIAAALELNNAFVAGLERIAAQVQQQIE